LIRALDPFEGVELIARRRGMRTAAVDNEHSRAGLLRGPGNLTVGLGIKLSHNRTDLTTGVLAVEDHGLAPEALTWSERIGIRVGTERPWRCSWSQHPAVSATRQAVRRRK